MRRLKAEAGMTLVELISAVIILGIVGGIVGGAIVSGFKTARHGQDRLAALADLQKGLERIGREIRAADPILVDPDNDPHDCVGAEVYRDGKRYTYIYRTRIGPSGELELLQDEAIYSPADATTPSATRIGLFIDRLANDRVDPPVPLFLYYNRDGELIDYEELAVLDATASPAQIKITLLKIIDDREPLRVETTVNIRSTRYGRDAHLGDTCAP